MREGRREREGEGGKERGKERGKVREGRREREGRNDYCCDYMYRKSKCLMNPEGHHLYTRGLTPTTWGGGTLTSNCVSNGNTDSWYWRAVLTSSASCGGGGTFNQRPCYPRTHTKSGSNGNQTLI